MNHLLKTQFGWCGVVFDNDAVKEIVLPSYNKHLVLQKLNNPNDTLKNNSRPQGRRPQANLALMAGGSPKAARQTPAITGLLKDLKRYFNGEKVDFHTRARYIADLIGASNFERAVYKTLMAIPYGRVRTYQWVAQKAGSPGASRAVGNALAKNPLPIIIPCHRVIKSNGSLGNFSAIGGRKLKKKLLDLENTVPKGFGLAKENY